MGHLKEINIYPINITDDGGVFHLIESPVDHMIKSIQYNLPNTDEEISNNETVCMWRENMPSIDDMPHVKAYQENYDTCRPDLHTSKLDDEFKKINTTVPIGQVLFHRGCWFEHNNEIVFTRYTSTSLDPAFARGVHQGDDVFVIITIKSPNIKFYFFDPNIESGHAEAEVLLEKDIKLVKKCSCKIVASYNSEKYEDIFCADAYKV